MKHINHFNQFLIKESFTPIEDIKELLEDYLLDYIDESLISSDLKLHGYVSEDEIELVGNDTFSSSSEMSKGSLPFYKYELKLNKRWNLSSIQNTMNRIKADKDFKIASYNAINSETLSSRRKGNDDIEEFTKIHISFLYMVNPKADTPEIVKEISEPLKKLGFRLFVNQFGESYYWTKSISKEVEMPLEWFSKTRQDGIYKPLSAKYYLVYSKVDEVFNEDVKSVFEEIKSVIPQLTNLTREESRAYSFRSKVDKLSVTIWSHATRYNRNSDLMELELKIQVSYFDRNH